MNANLGIVFRMSDREATLLSTPRRLRRWGDETVKEDGPERFCAPGIDGVEFQLFPLTEFIRGRLPSKEQDFDLEYAWMTGPVLDAYEMWAKANLDASEAHPFEVGLMTLLARSSFWALLFAPESDRVGSFVSVGSREAVQMLRIAAADIAGSEGFLAVKP